MINLTEAQGILDDQEWIWPLVDVVVIYWGNTIWGHVLVLLAMLTDDAPHDGKSGEMPFLAAWLLDSKENLVEGADDLLEQMRDHYGIVVPLRKL